jgi:glycosyltransferase involved in cell wall biosynthesis
MADKNTPPSINPAILFEPDGYMLDGPKLMGRQAAGNAFLRAAVAARGAQPLAAYTPHKRSAEIFNQVIKGIDPLAEGRWVPSDRLDLLSHLGHLYLPGPGLDAAAKLRLRASPSAYSLTGVTHTIASHHAMDSITGILSAPVMPWDALICTSTAVKRSVEMMLNAEQANLSWRYGTKLKVTLPQMPVIPLGVHCRDFEFDAAERKAARKAFGIADDEVVALFVGRLSFHAKAHPHPMYLGLEAAAQRTGKKITLIESGWFANDHIQQAFVTGAAQTCPSVKSIVTDGKVQGLTRQSWAAADIFVSMSDNIQESFGLTPIEAMAAALPAVVSDWDGYKDTVRDGIDGFRIPSWMPSAGFGEFLGRMHESNMSNYDMYCGYACQTVSVDVQVLADRLTDLVQDADLRKRIGEAGRKRAREVYDWAVVYGQYQELWGELGRIRQESMQKPVWRNRLKAAPKETASRMDPFFDFEHFPTKSITPSTIVALAPEATIESYRTLAKHSLFSYAAKILPSEQVVEKYFSLLAASAMDIRALARQGGVNEAVTVIAISVLAKMALVSLATKSSTKK